MSCPSIAAKIIIWIPPPNRQDHSFRKDNSSANLIIASLEERRASRRQADCTRDTEQTWPWVETVLVSISDRTPDRTPQTETRSSVVMRMTEKKKKRRSQVLLRSTQPNYLNKRSKLRIGCKIKMKPKMSTRSISGSKMWNSENHNFISRAQKKRQDNRLKRTRLKSSFNQWRLRICWVSGVKFTNLRCLTWLQSPSASTKQHRQRGVAVGKRRAVRS